MNETFHRGSARIYQFPAGGRGALGGRRLGETRSIDQTTPRVNEAMCCDSWYHEEAIQQEKALSKLPIKPSWER